MIKGSPKFDGLTISKIEVDFFKNPIHIEVTAAFVNSATGDTHGWTRAGVGWSEESRELLKRLCDSMERDLAGVHLTEGAVASAQTGLKLHEGNQPGGLGEHLGARTDAPSV